MNRLDEILTYRTLAFKHGNPAFTNSAIESAIAQGVTETKNVCAHLSLPLIDRLETALSVLEMSKRAFIESAIIDALDRFDSIAEQFHVLEPYYIDKNEDSEASS